MRRIVAIFRSILTLASIAAAVAAAASSVPLGLDLFRPVPADNPLTPAKVALGRRLFNERRLSRDGTVSCAGCHDPSRAFTDGRVVGVGVDAAAGRRNVPTIVNRVYGASFFWDGRAASIEQQVVQPLLDPREMAATPESIVSVLRHNAAYRGQFIEAFERDVQLDDVARALASYVRTIQSGDSRYDRFRNGAASALSQREQRGMRLFVGRANCWNCHAGPNLTDERFHNTGIAFKDDQVLDAGRFVVSQAEADRGAFKTPTLREVARTAPYMHDGSFATLGAVVEYYDRGGNQNPGLDTTLRPLLLAADDKRALVAFLRALSGRVQDGS